MSPDMLSPSGGSAAASSIIDSLDEVTPVVDAVMARTPDPRLREIMRALVKHAHAFARDVRLTEEEWEYGVDFLNRIGQATHPQHNEGVLASDAIGFSTLVCLLNNGSAGATETAAALLGPFWRMNSPRVENGGTTVRSPTDGPVLFTDARVTDTHGQPIEGVEIDLWQSSPTGYYENQDDTQADMNLRGKFTTDVDGRIAFRSVRPAGYPVPTDGPIGDLLRAQGRHPYRPAHLHFLCFKEGFKTLVTQVFLNDDERLGSDVVFGVTSHLIGDFRRHEPEEGAPASDVEGPWYSMHYDFVMEPGEAKLPRPPIA